MAKMKIELVSQKRIDKGMYWERALTTNEGCTPVSPGCQNCWAAAQANMRQHQKNPLIAARYAGLITNKKWNGKIRLLPQNLDILSKVKKPTMFSVWNDLFHEDVPDEFIDKVFSVMAFYHEHRFLILTKRPQNIRNTPLPDNVWLGVSAENQEMADKRIRILRDISAAIKFVSFEPLLGPIDFDADDEDNLIYNYGYEEYFDSVGKPPGSTHGDFRHIQWVIVGPETGPKRRECPIEWVRSIVEQCREAGVPCFVKALPLNGKISKNMNEWPADLRVREMPR